MSLAQKGLSWFSSLKRPALLPLHCRRSSSIAFWLLFSPEVVSDSLQPHGLHHPRLSCPSLSPIVCLNSCPLSRWCHPTILSSVVPFSSCLQSFPASVFFTMLALCIRWPKYWSFSFSISPSSEYSGLIFFRIDWLDLLEIQGTLKRLLQHHSSNHQFSVLSLLYGPTLTFILDYWKNYSFD